MKCSTINLLGLEVKDYRCEVEIAFFFVLIFFSRFAIDFQRGKNHERVPCFSRVGVAFGHDKWGTGLNRLPTNY